VAEAQAAAAACWLRGCELAARALGEVAVCLRRETARQTDGGPAGAAAHGCGCEMRSP